MENENKPTTFWEFVTHNNIVIPIIQRDYAQGRRKREVEIIRQELLTNIFNALTYDVKLYFDFVYGSLEGTVYIPLDGQQRLTTLFLLHWYLALKDGKLTNDNIAVLNRFTYETRISSGDFCKALVTGNHDNTLVVKDSTSISKSIVNSPWFFLSWKDDPTIQSMLVMLDSIHRIFHNVENGFDKLTDSEAGRITFTSLRLEHFGLTDALYIKMNSRGKPLTEFEIFKARLEKLIEDIIPAQKENFFEKIDGEWTDLFWNYKNATTFSFDKELMNFFRAIGTNRYAFLAEEEEHYKKIENRLTNRFALLHFSEYRDLGCFDKEGLNDVISTLDCLKNNQSEIRTYLDSTIYINEKAIFNSIIASTQELTYKYRIQFYALTQFAILYKSAIQNEFEEWARIVRNLTENTIYNRAEEFVRDMKSIKDLLPYASNILLYLSDNSNPLNGFTNLQKTEERIKANLILKNDRWEVTVKEFENHKYFNGQIGFALAFSGITTYFTSHSNVAWSDDELYFKSFENYVLKFKSAFNDNGLKPFRRYLWERALLAKGDYMVKNGRNHHFLENSDRDLSWKRLLRGRGSFEEKRGYIKSLLDDINVNLPIEDELQRVIYAGLRDESIPTWRKHILRDGGMIEVCHKRNIRWTTANNILLLQTSQTNGLHREFYSYSLCLYLRSRGNEVEYVPNSSVDYDKYISSINGKQILIDYAIYNQAWQYHVRDQDSFYFQSESQVISHLENNDYIKKLALPPKPRSVE